jgi:hypothetical protein
MSSFRVFPLPFNGMTDVAHPYRGLSHFSLIPSVEKLGLLRSILIYIYIYHVLNRGHHMNDPQQGLSHLSLFIKYCILSLLS